MRNSGAAVALRAWADGMRPPEVTSTAEWVAKNLVVTDGPYAGQLFDFRLAPYARGILDTIDDELINTVWVRKSAQVGFTQIGLGWVFANMVMQAAHDMIVQPTITMAQDFNRRKLQPAIDACAAVRGIVRRQVSRSSQGSTALVKAVPGGSTTLTGANSGADLRSKTIKRTLRDEIDEYPDDLDKQGDPMEMMDARQMSFRASGDWKKLCGSTPTVKGASKIDGGFLAGDQRYWHVPCPHCGHEQILVFGEKGSRHGLKFNREWPYEAHYVCEKNGCVIEHHHKAAMVRAGKWIATAPGAGKDASFHIDTLISQFVTWDDIAEKFLAVKDDPQALKGFVNSWLGQSWEERGEAPDWQKLLLRREDYAPRQIPFGGLMHTCGVDVQMGGLYYEIVSWGVDKQSWSIDAGYLTGDTADIRNPVWAELAELLSRRYPDAWGREWPLDAVGIDSGFNTNVVYDFVRRHDRVFATKGDHGWHKPSIATAPRTQQFTYSGKRRGAKVWHIGTWPLKAELYANLRKDGMRDGAEAFPPGYCHFSQELHDEDYFRQLTDEHLKTETRAGRTVQRWVDHNNNHFLDCRIIARAMAGHLGLERFTSEEWGAVIAERGPKDPDQKDIFAVALAGAAESKPTKGTATRRRRKMRFN